MELVNVTYAGQGKSSQDYSLKDKVLIESNFINASFGDDVDRVELFVYDVNGNLLNSTYNFEGYTPYQLINSETNKFSKILIDPVNDAKSLGFDRGTFNVQYNFNKNLFNSSDLRRYWIKEISPSRTELKLSSQTINDGDIVNGYNQYQAYVSLKNYYADFYLNFGNNESIIGINSAVVSDDTGTYLLIKLYEPLPFDYDVKTQLWIYDKISESVSYDVDIQIQAEVTSTANSLRGPNYSIRINEKNAQTTPYYSYASLLASPITSSVRQLSSYYQDKAISINVDFTNFSNFVHFSSATERLNNFVYKLGLIENYNSQIVSQSAIVGNSTIKTSAISTLQSAISNIVENFDIYEYYLYYSSESFAWPKYNSVKPYQNVSVTSSLALNWLGSATTIPSQNTSSLLYSASLYDDTNKDILRGVIPQYIYDDSNNQPYVTFMDMMGQHFDNVWVYYKDVTNRFNATNDPNTGISMDIVSDALRGMGMQLYTNTNVADNVYYDLFGYNYDGSLLPPTGSEKINTYVTSSLTTEGSKTLQQEIYKRIYHNLPYLLKTRGTQRSIKALISIYGIPESILTVNEFGAYNRNSIVGVDSINNSKISISTSSLEISSSVLSPYTSLQYYSNDNRLSSTNIEVGFSIADILNDNITSSLGYFSIDQLIGDPGYMYSSSYAPLVSASDAYFSSYTQPHSVWEYIRLIKYFNNSLFKTIQDFVPARANLSTGIIVKSHILERNKYARHEPSASFQDYSQSIDMLTLSAEPGNIFSGSNTNWSYSQVTPLGYVPISSSQDVEKLTGEFGGTEIIATDGQALSQAENSNNASVGLLTVTPSPIFQNVTASVRSIKYFDLDYTSDQLVPVNLGLITQSINDSVNNNFNTYNNPNNPYAQLQDYNYAARHFTDPRYYGSKVESATYNTYTTGDNSFGKTAAIDKIKPYFAYLVDIFSSSFQLPYRANAQIKYLIDQNQNILDLTKVNSNIFSVQNIFKSGESADVALFNYSTANSYVQRLTDDSNLLIYEGGYRYSPILFNVTGTGNLIYSLLVPSSSTSTTTSPAEVQIYDGNANWWTITNSDLKVTYNGFVSLLQVTGSQVGGSPSGTSTLATNIILNIENDTRGNFYQVSFQIAAGTTAPYYKPVTNVPSALNWQTGDSLLVNSVTQYTYVPGGSTTTVTTYTETVTDNNPCLYAIDPYTIKLSTTQSAIYGNFVHSASYQGIDTPVFPFSLGQMDLIRLYNTGSQWDLQSEYRVLDIVPNYSDSSGSFVLITIDRPLNPADTQSGTIPGNICKYIILKRLPDETNVILNYNLKQSITEDGLLYPQYVSEKLREDSGNIIKALRAQNLLPPQP